MDLAKLVERVEAGDDEDVDSRIAATFPALLLAKHIHEFEVCHSFRVLRGGGVAYYRGDDPCWYSMSSRLIPAFTTSLDAAVSFNEAALPGWYWEVNGDRQGGFFAITEGPNAGDECTDSGKERIPDPARALVLASLRALHTREGRG